MLVPDGEMNGLYRTYTGKGPDAGYTIKGFALFLGDDCMIFTPIPRDAYDADTLNTIVHELRHCIDGAFHS